jgi:tetratricopeptide (TPR) repeat protein
LTGTQWARAMLDLGHQPPMRDLFSLGFLGENAAKSYTAAGAFVSWVLEVWGRDTLRAWYGGGSIERLTGQRWADLDGSFRAMLRSLPMPPEVTAYARARFDRPSVWRRKCPHVVDALNRAADTCRDEHRYERASALFRRALSRDPTDWHARFALASDGLRRQDAGADSGRAALVALAGDDAAPRTWRDRAQEALADDDLANGRTAEAARGYREVASRTLDENVARTLEVKALAAENPDARRPIVNLLVGTPGRLPDPWLGALSIGAWAAESHEPLAMYLAGKNLASHEQWASAASWLDRARTGVAPTPRIARETLRERAICACALDDSHVASDLAAAIGAPDSPFEGGPRGRREWLLGLLDRCSSSRGSR